MYTLLIVDDEKMIRLGIQNGIEWQKHNISTVLSANSGKKALEELRKNNVDILITDLNMPEMTGIELVEKTKELYPDIKIIILTGYSDFDYAQQCLKLQVQDFLLKPVDENELIDTICKQLTEIKKMSTYQISMRAQGTKEQIETEKAMRKFIYKEETTVPNEFIYRQNASMEIIILIPEFTAYEDNASLQLLTIKDLCIEFIDCTEKGITFSDNDGRILIAYFTESELDDENNFYSLIDILAEETNIKFKLIIGSQVNDIQSLHISYNDALHLLKDEQKGFEDIIKSSTQNNKEKIIFDIYNEFKNNIIKNISDIDIVLHIFDNFKKATKSYNLSTLQIQKFTFDLVSNIYFSYIYSTNNKVENVLEKYINTLIGLNKNETFEVTEMIIKQILDKNLSEDNKIIHDAKIEIDENLDKNLSVSYLAEKFYLTPNYFSKLFKKITGEGCNEYIVKKRIEKSKSLLENTTLKIGKISLIVGYNDTNYFSLAFKKHVGISPSKYRESKQNN